jgi:phage tail-like protein
MPEIASAAQIGLPRIATPAAAGSAASTAVSAGRSLASELTQFRHLGLAMRFKVEVSDLGLPGMDLGNWTACEGLKVDFKYDSIRSGGDYATSHILPQVIVFGPVTLRRAVESPYSKTVQLWLSRVAAQWQAGTGEPNLGTTVTITMFDVYQNPEAPAASWQLQNAFPVSWAGPSMSAKGGEIAMETLVLEHDGFLEPTA